MPEHHSEAATAPPHRAAPAPGALLDPASSDRCGVLRFPHPETVRIGSATLIRADSLFDVLGALMPGSIGSVLTDPPYSSGALHARDRAQAPSQKYQSSEFKHLQAEFLGDNRDQRSFLAWSALWMHRAQLAMRPGAILAAFTDWRQLPVTTDALQVAGLVWRGIVPWDKTEAVRPQLGRYRNQAEFLVWGTNGHRAAVGRVAPGAYRASVPKAKLHMAAKPVSLMRDLLAIVDGPVLDPFMGSSPIGEACAEPGAAPAELQRLRAIRGGRDRHAGERPRGYRRAARLSRATGGDRGAARRGAPHRDRDAGSPRTRRWRASPRRFAPAARSLSRSAPPTRTSARIAGSARSGMPGLRRARAPPTASARPAARGGRKPPYPSCRRGTARGNLGHAGAARRHAGRGCRRAPRRISPR